MAVSDDAMRSIDAFVAGDRAGFIAGTVAVGNRAHRLGAVRGVQHDRHQPLV
jgi:hypothetical protein